MRLRGASPSGALRPDRAFRLVARSVHGRAALAARTPPVRAGFDRPQRAGYTGPLLAPMSSTMAPTFGAWRATIR